MIFFSSAFSFGFAQDGPGNAPDKGYYRYPTIHNETIVFVAEDDLWSVPLSGGEARRLTANLGTVSTPRFSPDGQWLAFTGTEEGPRDVYLMPANGGPVERLTWLGGDTAVVGWRGDRVIFTSDYGLPLRHQPWLYSIETDGTDLQRLNYGPAQRVSFSGEAVALGRKHRDPARWKRYRGGTAGEVWIDADGSGEFRELIELEGNLADPMWIGDRIYFLSDHEGIGNIYSTTPEGGDLQKHTDRQDFYARNASTDGRRIVYHAGADIFVYDTESGETAQVDITFFSPRQQTARRFEDAKNFLEDFSLSPDGSHLNLICRGKSFAMGCWEGPVLQQGIRHGVRYRLARILNDGERMVVSSDEGGSDHLEVMFMDNSQPPKIIDVPELGRPMQLKVSPTSDTVALTNHRNQLLVVDLQSGESTVVDRNEYSPQITFNWSPDGNWLTYDNNVNRLQSIIHVYNMESGERHAVTRAVRHDSDPVFDPEGKYIYFLSARIYNPVYDNLHFDLGFPRGMRPYVVTLRKDVTSPFVPEPEGFGKKDKKDDGKKDEEKENEESGEEESEEKDEKKSKPIEIDFDGIEDRVVAAPVAEGKYGDIAVIENRILYSTWPVEGALGSTWADRDPKPKGTLKYYDLKKREEKTLMSGISGFTLSRDRSALGIRQGKRLRVAASSSDKLDGNGGNDDKNKPSRQTGWIDLSRVRLSIEPRDEWRQMLAEAWRLQRHYFWVEDMSQVAWDEVLERYLPLVDRISSRHEFADLIWEMQGELGTSHAYELGGDYRERPTYGMGYLGADLEFDADANVWRFANIPFGDTWDPKNAPPLSRPGVNVSEGMRLLAVGGRPVNAATPPHQLLVNMADAEVQLTVAQADGSASRTVVVKTLKNETMLRYRDWVEANRRAVHEKSDGCVGYVHIPNMGALGYSEFHRYFLTELDHDGLIVDVRYNGGGHVSELLIEKLARTRIAYVKTRWMGADPYPSDSPKGPMVMLTNEFAGSDGDIVTQAFKLLELGKTIGQRTWGGVIGIWPRNSLVDGTLTTQPEFSFWFKDVGWGVENYGVDPDIEVDILPQDWAAGSDPQLQRGIEEVLQEIEENPPLEPDFGNRPDLSLP